MTDTDEVLPEMYAIPHRPGLLALVASELRRASAEGEARGLESAADYVAGAALTTGRVLRPDASVATRMALALVAGQIRAMKAVPRG